MNSRYLIVDKPSIFTLRNPKQKTPIFKNGDFFYFAGIGKEREFTLPAGTYLIDGNNDLFFLGYLNRKPIFPKKERDYTHKRLTRIIRVNNWANVASIYFYDDEAEIIADETVFTNEPIKKAILYHEIAHYYYTTEHYCDVYAFELMLTEGYNPSQIYAAFDSTLYNKMRKSELKNKYAWRPNI